MKKNIFYSNEHGLLTVQEALSLGFDVKPTSAASVLAGYGLERLVQTPPPQTDNFNYLEEVDPVRQPDGSIHRAYKLVGHFDHLDEAEGEILKTHLRQVLELRRIELETCEVHEQYTQAFEQGYLDEPTGYQFSLSTEDSHERLFFLTTWRGEDKKDLTAFFTTMGKTMVELSGEEADRIARMAQSRLNQLNHARSAGLMKIRQSMTKTGTGIPPAPRPVE